MSNNTNTLFWVITGAVIVLGVFALVNNTTTVSKVFDGLNNTTNETINNQNNTNIDKLKYDRTNANANNNYTYLNDKDYLLESSIKSENEVEWVISNLSDKEDTNTHYSLEVYDSNTNIKLGDAYFDVPLNIPMNGKNKISTYFGEPLLRGNVYFKLVVE